MNIVIKNKTLRDHTGHKNWVLIIISGSDTFRQDIFAILYWQ